ncbi:hypothetical protein [Polaromonas sp.]|uniref:hypothetical protein n=1 Tax=Polaromonas sp. TaxID=1869339 RepID=UPI0032674C56
MSNQPSLKFSAQFALAVAGVLFLPALWSLGSAFWSAATTGQVLVLSVGRYETSHSMVPWPQGWARFAGPFVLALSLSMWATSKSAQRVTLWWFSAALGFVGIVLLLFSQWFVSWRGVLWFCSLTAFVALSFYIGSKFGRIAMVAFMLIVFAFVGWQVGRGAWQ